MPGPPREIRVAEFEQMFADTVAFWRSWLSRSTYRGRWRRCCSAGRSQSGSGCIGGGRPPSTRRAAMPTESPSRASRGRGVSSDRRPEAGGRSSPVPITRRGWRPGARGGVDSWHARLGPRRWRRRPARSAVLRPSWGTEVSQPGDLRRSTFHSAGMIIRPRGTASATAALAARPDRLDRTPFTLPTAAVVDERRVPNERPDAGQHIRGSADDQTRSDDPTQQGVVGGGRRGDRRARPVGPDQDRTACL
jgi:hypothetical protein